MRTPTHKQPVTDYVGVREKASSQKRDVERALTGWAKRAREIVKDPAPQEVMLDMGVWMLNHGRGESAACMALQLEYEAIGVIAAAQAPPGRGRRSRRRRHRRG